MYYRNKGLWWLNSKCCPLWRSWKSCPKRGCDVAKVGTIVENLAPGVYEVEFSDDDGRTYASMALTADRLMRLYHSPSPKQLDSPKPLSRTVRSN